METNKLHTGAEFSTVAIVGLISLLYSICNCNFNKIKISPDIIKNILCRLSNLLSSLIV